MSPHLGAQGLYPATDGQLSRSALLKDDTFDQTHIDTINTVRRRLFEYYQFNLAPSFKKLGESFLYMNDGGVTVERIKRTRLVQLFLTQGYHGCGEMWTGKPGVAVPLSHTVETCRRILDGEFDDLSEKAWFMMGRMEGILERSKMEDVKKED